jgi:hypothetical protein
MSITSRQKLSASLKRHYQLDEARERAAQRNIGRKLSEASRLQIGRNIHAFFQAHPEARVQRSIAARKWRSDKAALAHRNVDAAGAGKEGAP